ncbi:unnamed protein product [Parascedosporium putredinis]|uniref:C3H1-type domain-containing protein n=1 Tax=Parascedosporium putredinis TaxID=1442378 RepID=A0A9P1H4F9_9PEZI|nr:unnamed protein product [Parascedosporium putredinis]CAI7998251.1 unnamed protein product [Parascedosporium putredinis]
MANFLASIFGTELDKVNCSFYFKIGACRHGDRCSRKHVKPSYSQTILMPNLYQNPAYDPKNRMNPSQLQNHFDAFYEDVWCELCKYGELEELVVCDNNNDPFPVTDFREACCRLNSGEGCVRGGFCNFIHRKNPGEELDRELTLATKKWLRMSGKDEKTLQVPHPRAYPKEILGAFSASGGAIWTLSRPADSTLEQEYEMGSSGSPPPSK